MKAIFSKQEKRKLTEEEKKELRNEYIRIGIVMVFLLLLLLLSDYLKRMAVAEDAQSHSPVQEILSAYGNTDDQSVQAMDAHFQNAERKHMDISGIDISVEEVLYDGVWVYSTVYVHPQKGQSISIVPGGADLSDEIAVSTEGEGLSFLEIAEQEGNRLLAVYCYPQEFDSQGIYFMDYVQDVEGDFYLVSGCNFPLEENGIPLTMMLEVYEIDPDTLHYSRVARETLPAETFSPFAPVTTYEYRALQETDLFDTVTLLKTGVTSYLYINWKNAEVGDNINALPLTEDMELIPEGYAPDAHAIYLEELPEVMNILFPDDDDLTITVQLSNGGNENE